MLTVDTKHTDLRAHLWECTPPEAAGALREIAYEVRRDIVRMIDRAQMGHIGGDFSVADILVTLFGAVVDVDPRDPRRPDRDRMILSKGHCSAALYATLARFGFFPRDELMTFMAPLSMLNGHPDRKKVPGVETNTGPLGHGLPVGVGCALAAKLKGESWRTYVVLGDGELQEGSNWEAAMYAGHRGLSNLTAIVDRNRLQQGDRTEATNALDPLEERWRAFGWEVRSADGHDHADLLTKITDGRDELDGPLVIVADTIKGKGVSFIEDRAEWHHKVPSAEQVQLALQELSA